MTCSKSKLLSLRKRKNLWKNHAKKKVANLKAVSLNLDLPTGPTLYYKFSVSKLESRVEQLKKENDMIKSTETKTENHCKMLIEQHEKLAEILEKRVPLEHHEASVHECKR
jgi:hypothetical protein